MRRGARPDRAGRGGGGRGDGGRGDGGPDRARPGDGGRGAAGPDLRGLLPEHRLRRLELTITRRLDGLLHGQYHGLLPGPGSEPAGSREYRPGEDEVRRMDWAVTARTATPHVRQLDADRELTTWLVVDNTASMSFGTAELDKRELALAAAAAVGFLSAGTGNRLGAVVPHHDGLRRWPARTGRTHLLGVLRRLIDDTNQSIEDAAGPTSTGRDNGPPRSGGGQDGSRRPEAGQHGPGLVEALDDLHRTAVRRGLVVVVSDFLDDLPEPAGTDPPGYETAAHVPAWERALRRLGARHQVLAVEVTDPRELELPDVGLITLVDPETGQRRMIPTGDRRLRERYAEAAAAERRFVAGALRRAGAVHLPLRTDRDWVADIVRHVRLHRRLARLGAPTRPITVAGGTR